MLRLVVARGLRPALVAGHSMGEFAGLVAAEALDPLDALAAVRARGAAMSAAAPQASGMIAVLGEWRLCAASPTAPSSRSVRPVGARWSSPTTTRRARS